MRCSLKLSHPISPCPRVSLQNWCPSGGGQQGPEWLQVDLTVSEDSRDILRAYQWRGGGQNLGTSPTRGINICSRQGRAGAQLARIPGSGFASGGTGIRKLESILQKQNNKTSASLSPCPNRSSPHAFPSYKIPSRALLIPEPPLHSAEPLQRQRKGPLFPAPEFPGIFSPRGSSAPRCCCFFTHGFAMGLFST